MRSGSSGLAKPAARGAGQGTRFDIGGIRLERIVESETPMLDPAEIYPDSTAAIIESNLDWLAPRFYDRASGLLVITIQGFLVRSQGRTIIVDTCVGDCKPRRRAVFDRQRWNWLDRLAHAGVRPENVDTVICTHFHVDHVGWNTRLADGRWVPTFPNARYLFAREEWAFWKSDLAQSARDRSGDYVGDSVVPIVDAGLADFVAMDHRINSEVSLVPQPGHTPGLVGVALRSGSEEAVLASDLLHSPLQCRYPEWSTRFCIDPDQSRRTRMDFLARHAGSGVIVIPTHFPSPSAGTIERDGGAYRFQYVE
jgi:glyoxylase-like metal-dependent hydrolase (beta-lactamase superfamily II)